MITIDVTTQIMQLDGKTAATGEDNKTPLTVRSILELALLARQPRETLDGPEQLNRFILATKIRQNDAVELESDQVVKLKTLVAAICGPLVTGQIHLLLEGKDMPW